MSAETLLPVMPRVHARHREARVGLFAILGVFAIWFALMTLTSPALFRGRYVLRTSVPNAAGIRKGDPVRMRGVNIGRVIGFGIGSQGVQLQLEIEGAYQVPSDSRVELKGSGLLAGMVADVLPGSSPRKAAWGDALPGANGPGMLDKVDSLAGEADNVTLRLQSLISDETIRNVRDGSGRMNTLLGELSTVVGEQRGELQALSTSLRKSAEGVEKVTTGPELQRVVTQVDELVRRMDTLVSKMDRSAASLDGILTRIDKGEGTLGKLSRDDALYRSASQATTDFGKAAVELQKLVDDVRRQPKRYLSVSLF
jgi:phospholipid/cholesterol/gamma-HCH transport system substrate-binding protein